MVPVLMELLTGLPVDTPVVLRPKRCEVVVTLDAADELANGPRRETVRGGVGVVDDWIADAGIGVTMTPVWPGVGPLDVLVEGVGVVGSGTRGVTITPTWPGVG